MKKIMFNDRYGLTQAVIEGRKTLTRRLMNNQLGNLVGRIGFTKKGRDLTYVKFDFDNGISEVAPYAIGEVLAVAQSYKQVYHAEGLETMDMVLSSLKNYAGWNNKMFVWSSLMPHRIRIIDIRVERLQDISEEDCMKEGIYRDYGDTEFPPREFYDYDGNNSNGFDTLGAAFASLIDKVSGRGTWESNPWVFAYEFELIR